MILFYALFFGTAASAAIAVVLVALGYGPGGRRERMLRDPAWLHNDYAFDRPGVQFAQVLTSFVEDLERLDVSATAQWNGEKA